MTQSNDSWPSTAAIRGHPLHPILVPLPIGFLVGALLADVGYAVTGDLFWSRGAFWLLAGGVVTALVAAPFGLVDFLTIPHARRHTIGWLHFLGNLCAVAVAVVNLAIRWSDAAGTPFPWGLLLSLVTVLILVGTGWAGGELTFRHRIGVLPLDAEHTRMAAANPPPRSQK